MGTNVAAAPALILQFLNNSGQPNVGGSLLTQVGGVNYPTWQDAAGNTPLPNPIPLNSRGEISNSSGVSSQLFLATAVTYTLTLYDASNNAIWTAANVTAQGAAAVGAMTDEKGSDGTPGFKAGTDFVAGTSQTLTLSGFYGSTSNLWVAFDGAEQGANSYQLTGFTLTFGSYVGGVFVAGPIPVGVSTVFVKGGTTLTIGTPGTQTVTDASVAPSSRLYNRIFDSVDVRDYGATGGGIVDDSQAFINALNSGHLVYVPAGTYLIKQSLTVQPGLGMYGEGEKSILTRGFTGGKLINVPNAGTPFMLRNFLINTSVSITVANGDTGIDIGSVTSWAGRGDIANLYITGQWDGFKWAGGSEGPINNVWANLNKGHGFYSVGGRGELRDCLAQFNSGNGFHFVAQPVETGVQMVNCGTFANQGWGFLFDAAPSVTGANIWMTACSASNDGTGGIGFVKNYTQIWISQQLIEGAGNANQFQPSFPVVNTAPGLFITNGCTAIMASDFLIQNCYGAGATLDTVSQFVLNNFLIRGNGIGVQGAFNQTGLNVASNCSNGIISNLIADLGSNQIVDIGLGSSNQIQFVEATFRTYSNASSSQVQFTGRFTSATTSVASASSVLLWDYTDVMTVTGTTTINNLQTPGTVFYGRRVTLLLPSGITINNSGNIKLAANLTTTAAQALTLTTDGTNWFQG